MYNTEILKYVAKAFETGEAQIFEFWGKRKNGEIFPKEVILSPGYYFGQKAIIVVSRDISESKRITNELILAKDNY